MQILAIYSVQSSHYIQYTEFSLSTVYRVQEASPEWNKVPDLMMETGEEEGIIDAATKMKRKEVAQGHRKRWKEDDIRAEKRKHLPSVQKRTRKPAGF